MTLTLVYSYDYRPIHVPDLIIFQLTHQCLTLSDRSKSLFQIFLHFLQYIYKNIQFTGNMILGIFLRFS